MDLIKMAREMGKEIQQSEVYKNLVAAKEKNDSVAKRNTTDVTRVEINKTFFIVNLA